MAWADFFFLYCELGCYILASEKSVRVVTDDHGSRLYTLVWAPSVFSPGDWDVHVLTIEFVINTLVLPQYTKELLALASVCLREAARCAPTTSWRTSWMTERNASSSRGITVPPAKCKMVKEEVNHQVKSPTGKEDPEFCLQISGWIYTAKWRQA